MTQNNLGNALRVLGERESGTARLEAAVRAYEEALKEYTREKVPLAWAGTRMNLGTALYVMGERHDDSEKIERAIGIFDAVLPIAKSEGDLMLTDSIRKWRERSMLTLQKLNGAGT